MESQDKHKEIYGKTPACMSMLSESKILIRLWEDIEQALIY